MIYAKTYRIIINSQKKEVEDREIEEQVSKRVAEIVEMRIAEEIKKREPEIQKEVRIRTLFQINLCYIYKVTVIQ